MGAKKEWFRDWFDRDYLDLYAHRNEADALLQLDLIRRTLPDLAGKRVLDLGCGAGRHLEIMSDWGWRAAGIDLSLTLLLAAQNRNARLSLIQGDIRGFFALFLALFASFGYFETEEQNQAVFSEIAACILPGGFFWLDFLNPDFVCARLRENETVQSRNGRKVAVRRRLQQGRVIKELDLGCRVVTESVGLYDLKVLRRMAKLSGMRERALFGDYRGGAYTADSPRTILLLERTG